MNPDSPIGIFDSGVGGLTVLRAVRELLPAEHLVYLGDTARVPYGNKAPATVARYAIGCAEQLVERDIKALVIACNTASAYGLDAVRASLEPRGIAVLGVIEPVARRAVTEYRARRAAAAQPSAGAIGVIGTRGTVSSGAYPAAIGALEPTARVVQVPSPLLVPLAEEGWVDDPVTREVARRYVESFGDTDLDALILGCTHYPILVDVLRDVLAELGRADVAILDSATASACALRALLDTRDIARMGDSAGEASFCVTDAARFAEVGARFLGHPLGTVEHIDLR